MIRILRLASVADLISAQVFDDAFALNLSPDIAVEPVDFSRWLHAVFGAGEPRPDDGKVQETFRLATRGYHFLCPNYRAIPVAPLLLHLRNRSRSPIRLLFIAHAPGAYALEWALLRPLLRAGDRIVAPTESARDVIDLLCPALTAGTRVIPHPITPLPCAGDARRTTLVSLTRMHSSKLLHRQVEAMAALRKRGLAGVRMRIAGPLREPGATDPTPYVLSLAAKIRRLGLEGTVELVGRIEGAAAKACFLDEARLLVNLSGTVEESFGKAIVEALGAGVPVLATRWNGFPEVVGGAGSCVPVDVNALDVDLPAERIADAVESLLAGPPSPAQCREQAARFDPLRVRRLYREQLEDALAELSDTGATDSDGPGHTEPAAPPHGLLHDTAPLTCWSWRDLFAFHVRDVTRLREQMAGTVHREASETDELRALLLFGTRSPLSRVLAGLAPGASAEAVGKERPSHAAPAGDFFTRLAEASRSRGTIGSRLACLALTASTGRLHQLQLGLLSLSADGVAPPILRHLEIEALRQGGQFQQAFRLSVQVDAHDDGEMTVHRVRQLAAVCREWPLPGMALPALREWLGRFPDSPGSALVWLDRCLNSLALAPALLDEARLSFDAARALLGASASLVEIEPWLRANPASEAAAS